MFRYQYYNGYIEILENSLLLELKKDIEKDFIESKLEYYQYKQLLNKINNKLKLNNNSSENRYIAKI